MTWARKWSSTLSTSAGQVVKRRRIVAAIDACLFHVPKGISYSTPSVYCNCFSTILACTS